MRYLGFAVNHDGRNGSAPDPHVWDQKSKRKQRRADIRVNVNLASLPGPPGFLNGLWVQVHDGCITGADVAAWPDSVSLSFWGTLHWPAGAEGLGHFGISYLEVMILFEQWAGRQHSSSVTAPLPLPSSFSPGLFIGMVGGLREEVTTAHLLDNFGSAVKRVRLTRKTCPGIPVHGNLDEGLPTPKRWKRLHPPDSSGAVSPAEGAGALAPARQPMCNSTSAPQPPQPQPSPPPPHRHDQSRVPLSLRALSLVLSGCCHGWRTRRSDVCMTSQGAACAHSFRMALAAALHRSAGSWET